MTFVGIVGDELQGVVDHSNRPPGARHNVQMGQARRRRQWRCAGPLLPKSDG
jgi:hypothetical protein